MNIHPIHPSNSQVNISPPKQERPLNWKRIIQIVMVLLAVLGLILIGLGFAGVISQFIGLTSGLMLITTPLTVNVVCYLRKTMSSKKKLTPTHSDKKKLSPMRSNLINYAKNYCLKERDRHRHTDDFTHEGRSTNRQYEILLSNCASNTLKNIYLQNSEIMKCFCKLDSDKNKSKEDLAADRLRIAFSLYYIIQQTILQKDSLFKEASRNIKDVLKSRSTPLPRLCLFFAPWRDGRMTVFRAGISSFIASYAYLRKTLSEEPFFSSGTPYYQLRLMFNDVMTKMDEIFDLKKVKEEYPECKPDMGWSQENITNLIYWSCGNDDTPGSKVRNLALKASTDNKGVIGRGYGDIFIP